VVTIVQRQALPALIALFFALWGLRGSGQSDVTFNDQARHAMNGVVLHDLVRDGQFARPVQYIRQYFSRYPTLSLPYHPPLFPAVEAVVYALVGISHFSARLTVALFVFGVALLLFQLALKTSRSTGVAATAAIVFLSIPLSQQLAADVMLEMPAMFFTLGSMLCICQCDRRWTDREALAAGLLGGAAVWTKQAVFIALIPLLLLAGRRRWDILRSRPALLFALVFAVSGALLGLLWFKAGLVGFAKNWGDTGLFERLIRNAGYYSDILMEPRFGAFVIGSVVLAAYARWRTAQKQKPDAEPFYVSWIGAVLLVLLAVPAFDVRYIWFALPPAVILVATGADLLARDYLPRQFGVWVVPAAAVCMLLLNLNVPAPSLSGPSEAARVIVAEHPRRVLVGAVSNGSIMFAVRSIYPGSDITFIRADKLSADTFQPARMEQFAHRFGINVIIFDQTVRAAPRDDLTSWPSRNMQKLRIIPKVASEPAFSGKLFIYRFLNPSPLPQSTLTIPINASGDMIDLTL
jgi:hypothetical protein